MLQEQIEVKYSITNMSEKWRYEKYDSRLVNKR